MSLIEQTPEQETIAEETNTVKRVLVLVVIIISSLIVFSLMNIIHYLVLKKELTESHRMTSPTSMKEDVSQQVKRQDLLLPKETVSLKKIEDTKKEIKTNLVKPRKSSNTKFTIQVGAFRNPLYAQILVTRLDIKGYKVYVDPVEEKDKKVFRVFVGKFSDRQKAESLSKKILKTENLQTFITLH